MASLSLSVLSTTRIMNCRAGDRNHTHDLFSKGTLEVKIHYSGWAQAPHSGVCSCDANNPFTMRDSDPAWQKTDGRCVRRCKRGFRGSNNHHKGQHIHNTLSVLDRKSFENIWWLIRTERSGTRSRITEHWLCLLVAFCVAWSCIRYPTSCSGRKRHRWVCGLSN